MVDIERKRSRSWDTRFSLLPVVNLMAYMYIGNERTAKIKSELEAWKNKKAGCLSQGDAIGSPPAGWGLASCGVFLSKATILMC